MVTYAMLAPGRTHGSRMAHSARAQGKSDLLMQFSIILHDHLSSTSCEPFYFEDCWQVAQHSKLLLKNTTCGGILIKASVYIAHVDTFSKTPVRDTSRSESVATTIEETPFCQGMAVSGNRRGTAFPSRPLLVIEGHCTR